jgi:SDR family mycofactocin-dependent oxidoreductase
MGRMDGKNAFVTGAARGQGRAHALTLAEEGADVVLFDIARDIPTLGYPLPTLDDLHATAREVQDLGRRAIAIQGDTREQADLDAAVERGVRELGPIDVFVANAGIWGIRPLLEISDAEWQDSIDVNLTGNFHSTRAIAPHMIERGGGSIVYIASIAGLTAGVPYAHYTAAKHGVIGLMRTAAIELGRHGIRCNAVCPGFVDTTLSDWQEVWDLMAGTGPGTGTPEDRRRSAAHQSALAGRGMIAPASISRAVLYLASDDSVDVTGTTLTIDDGALTLPPYNPGAQAVAHA